MKLFYEYMVIFLNLTPTYIIIPYKSRIAVGM